MDTTGDFSPYRADGKLVSSCANDLTDQDQQALTR